jgi:DHA2 family multidrug resistance protein-like MFS transporter
VFASAIPFALASLLLGRSLPEPPPREGAFDVTGAVQCAAMFGLIVAGAESAVHGDSPVVSAAIVAAGFGVGLNYVRREKLISNPILPVDLLGQAEVALSVIGAFAAFIAAMTLLLSTPFRLTQAYGFSPWQVGAVIAPWPLANIVVAPLAGWLSDRIPAGLLGGIAATVMAATSRWSAASQPTGA